MSRIPIAVVFALLLTLLFAQPALAQTNTASSDNAQQCTNGDYKCEYGVVGGKPKTDSQGAVCMAGKTCNYTCPADQGGGTIKGACAAQDKCEAETTCNGQVPQLTTQKVQSAVNGTGSSGSGSESSGSAGSEQAGNSGTAASVGSPTPVGSAANNGGITSGNSLLTDSWSALTSPTPLSQQTNLVQQTNSSQESALSTSPSGLSGGTVNGLSSPQVTTEPTSEQPSTPLSPTTPYPTASFQPTNAISASQSCGIWCTVTNSVQSGISTLGNAIPNVVAYISDSIITPSPAAEQPPPADDSGLPSDQTPIELPMIDIVADPPQFPSQPPIESPGVVGIFETGSETDVFGNGGIDPWADMVLSNANQTTADQSSPEGLEGGTPEGTPTESPSQTVQEGGPQGTPDGVANGSPNGSPEGSDSGAANGSPNGSPNGNAQSNSQSGASNGSPNGGTQGQSGSPSGNPNGAPGGVPNGTPGSTSQTPSGTPTAGSQASPIGSIAQDIGAFLSGLLSGFGSAPAQQQAPPAQIQAAAQPQPGLSQGTAAQSQQGVKAASQGSAQTNTNQGNGKSSVSAQGSSGNQGTGKSNTSTQGSTENQAGKSNGGQNGSTNGNNTITTIVGAGTGAGSGTKNTTSSSGFGILSGSPNGQQPVNPNAPASNQPSPIPQTQAPLPKPQITQQIEVPPPQPTQVSTQPAGQTPPVSANNVTTAPPLAGGGKIATVPAIAPALLSRLLNLVSPTSANAGQPPLQNLQNQLNTAYEAAKVAGENAAQKQDFQSGKVAENAMRQFIAKAKQVAQTTGAATNNELQKAINTTEALSNKMASQFQGSENRAAWPFYWNWQGTTETFNGVTQTFGPNTAGFIAYLTAEGQQMKNDAANLNNAGNNAIQESQHTGQTPPPQNPPAKISSLGTAAPPVVSTNGESTGTPPPANPPAAGQQPPANTASPATAKTPAGNGTPPPQAPPAPAAVPVTFTNSGKSSWFGNCGGSVGGCQNVWTDTSDNGHYALRSVPESQPGVAFYNKSTLGQYFLVQLPNGQLRVVEQVDIGPAPWTGRTIDINAALAENAGYTPSGQNAYPTNATVAWRPLGAISPSVAAAYNNLLQQGKNPFAAGNPPLPAGSVFNGANPISGGAAPCTAYKGCATPTPNQQVAAARVSGLTSLPSGQTAPAGSKTMTDPTTGASFYCTDDQATCQTAFQQQAALSRGCANGTIPCNAQLKNFQVQTTGETQAPQPSAQPRLSIRSNVYGVNPVIQTIATQASKYLPPGYSVQIISGTRQPGQSHVSDSYHFTGKAVDFLIYGPNGQVYNPTGCAEANKSCAGTFAMYQGFMQNMKAIQNQTYPQLSGVGRWGGYFISGDSEDEMHYDLGPSAPNPNSAGNWQSGLSATYASYAPGQVGQGMTSSQPVVQSANGTAQVPLGNIIDPDTGQVVASNVPLPPGSLNPDGTITLPVDSNGNPIPSANGTPTPVTLPVGAWSPDNTTYTLPDDRPQLPQPMYDPSVTNPWPPNGNGNPYASPYASAAPVAQAQQQPQPIAQPLSQPQMAALMTPQLQCSPASVPAASSTPIAISWSCLYGTPMPTGFATNGQQFGQTFVQSPQNATSTLQFALTCVDPTGVQPTPVPAICSVGVTNAVSTTTATSSQSSVSIIANPGSVQSGGTSLISWSSVGTSACAVTLPDGTEVGSSALNGSALSPDLSATTIFTASCTTVASTTITATTSVTVQ